jgi:hypothetical protein
MAVQWCCTQPAIHVTLHSSLLHSVLSWPVSNFATWPVRCSTCILQQLCHLASPMLNMLAAARQLSAVTLLYRIQPEVYGTLRTCPLHGDVCSISCDAKACISAERQGWQMPLEIVTSRWWTPPLKGLGQVPPAAHQASSVARQVHIGREIGRNTA